MWFNGTSPCELGQYCGGIYKLQWKKCLFIHICQEQKYVCVVRFISYLIGSGLTCFVCVCTGRCAGGEICGAVDHVVRRPDQIEGLYQ